MPKRKTGSTDESFGQNLAFYRKIAGYTQQQIADMLNINRTTYTKYETGASEPSIEIMKKLSEILKVDINSLFNGEDENAALSDITDEEFVLTAEQRIMLRRYGSLNREDRIEIEKMIHKLSGEK